MNITYTWLFSNFKVQKVQGDFTDVVITLDWRRIAKADNFSADVYGQISLPAPASENFTAFDQLTLAQVTEWVETELTPERVAEYDASLANNLALQQNPPTELKPAPWTNSSEVPLGN